MEQAKAIWERLGLPPLATTTPGGYDLGHWRGLARQAEMAAKQIFRAGKNLANERRSDVAIILPVKRNGE